jgi:hypothetical protein
MLYLVAICDIVVLMGYLDQRIHSLHTFRFGRLVLVSNNDSVNVLLLTFLFKTFVDAHLDLWSYVA